MSTIPALRTPSPLRRAREIAGDFLLATALIWTLPLLLGAARALVGLLGRAN